MKQNKKLDKAALEWMEPYCRYSMYDCSDSMHEVKVMESRFDALADDKFSIEKYVKKFHLPALINMVKETAEENSELEELEKDWKNFTSHLPCPFPDFVTNYFDK